MQKTWYKLDTAALIFPAARTGKWANAFRLSAELKDEIDPQLLQQAVSDLKNRFPNFFVKLSSGMFWYRLETADTDPKVSVDYAYPLVHMSRKTLRHNCMRVLYFKNRIALEIFHSVTDGTGGIFFFKSLLRRYIFLKYSVSVPDSETLPCLDDQPSSEELEDSFFKNSCGYSNAFKEERTYRLKGTDSESSFRNLVTGTVDSELLQKNAHKYGCSVTTFLCAVMAKCLIKMQSEDVRKKKKQRKVKVTIPVNLRRLYKSKTMRNFVLTLNVGVDPKLGDYTLGDLCNVFNHQLKAWATPQFMAGQIAQNIIPQQSIFVRLVPLFIKNMLMNMVYNIRGEKGGCINISNLGIQDLPEELEDFVNRLDFIIGVQKTYPNNCSVVSFKGLARINFIRVVKETRLEREFFSYLVELGIPVFIESNEE